jgi:hypothetical protein
MVKQQQCARKRKPLSEAERARIGRHRRKQNSTYSLPAAGGSDRVRARLHDALTAAEDFVDAAAVRRALADLRSHIAAKAGVPSNGSTAPIGQPANPVVWQPGVRLDEVATMHALELAYGGRVLLLSCRNDLPQHVDADALLRKTGVKAVCLHDGERVIFVAEAQAPLIGQPGPLTKEERKDLLYTRGKVATKRSHNVGLISTSAAATVAVRPVRLACKLTGGASERSLVAARRHAEMLNQLPLEARRALQERSGGNLPPSLFPAAVGQIVDVPHVSHRSTGIAQVDAAWLRAEERAARLIGVPGFGELELLRCALAQVWRECEWTFEARLLPKVSTSVGDRKALHNDGNGTALTAHVVVEAGDRESEMCVLFGRMEITVAMERPRTTFFLASLPHCTRRVGDKGFSNTSNTSKDKVYMSAYWTADVERLLREAGLERGVALGATYGVASRWVTAVE